MSLSISSSFTLNEIGAVILARVGPVTSTARCVLQAAPIAQLERAMVPAVLRP